MAQTESDASIKVPFTADEAALCICPECPVQKSSACSRSKASTLTTALKKSPLVREEVPGMYCATGVASCSDLDLRKSCICIACSVFERYQLIKRTPSEYYCRDGSPA